MKKLLTDTAIVAIGLTGLFYGPYVFQVILAAGVWLLFNQPLAWASESPVRLMVVYCTWFAFWIAMVALMYWLDQQSQPREPNAGGERTWLKHRQPSAPQINA